MARSCCSAASTPLRAAGLKRTAQREAILAVLEAADRPLTADDIHQRMGSGASGVPTLYRNLQRFVEEGWAEVLPSPDPIQRFVRCRSRGHHHHVECIRCGRVDEVEACRLEGALRQLESESGYQILVHHLVLKGLCPACRKPETPE